MRLSLMKMPELPTLGGRPSTPRELARLCVTEKKAVHGRLYQDEKGKLKEIRFDKVKES